MFFISLTAFAHILYILNLNRVDASVHNSIYDSLVGFGPVDAFIHSYLAGLGAFYTTNYNEEDA